MQTAPAGANSCRRNRYGEEHHDPPGAGERLPAGGGHHPAGVLQPLHAGCTEHYLAHAIRPHPDFLPELDLVLELDGRVVGNIMYTKSTLVDEAGKEKGILTFGPVCIRPGLQRRGYGRLLMEESFRRRPPWGTRLL